MPPTLRRIRAKSMGQSQQALLCTKATEVKTEPNTFMKKLQEMPESRHATAIARLQEQGG